MTVLLMAKKKKKIVCVSHEGEHELRTEDSEHEDYEEVAS